MLKIAILGSGGWGLALACTCSRLGHDVTVWSAFKDELDSIRRTGELRSKLPGVYIPESIHLTEDISCASDKDIVLVGIPSKFVRSVCLQAKPYVSSDTIVVSTAKGLEDGSLKRMMRDFVGGLCRQHGSCFDWSFSRRGSRQGNAYRGSSRFRECRGGKADPVGIF